MERIVQGRSGTITKTFSFTPTGTPTVTATRDDGTAVSGTVGTTADPKAFTFTIPAANNQLLDTLRLTWSAVSGGSTEAFVDTVEVAGDSLFSIAELRPYVPAATTDAQIAAIRTRVEQAIEDACGLAFVPRYDRATLNGDGTTMLRLGRPFLRRVRWMSTVVAGVTTVLLPTDLSVLSISPAGFVAGYTWPRGYGSVQAGFEHGMDRPPEPVRAAALDYARFLLTQDTSIDSRAERLVTDDGTLVFAGSGATPVPTVNQVIDSYRMPAVA